MYLFRFTVKSNALLKGLIELRVDICVGFIIRPFIDFALSSPIVWQTPIVEILFKILTVQAVSEVVVGFVVVVHKKNRMRIFSILDYNIEGKGEEK